MNLNYYLIQYVEDPLTQEGRNVGVVAYGGGKAYFRALGVGSDGAINSELFGLLSSYAKGNAWAYREWANWFWTLVKNEGKNPELLEHILDGLEKDGYHIVAKRAGRIEVPKGEAPSVATTMLFNALIKAPVQPRIRGFENHVKETIDRSEISFRPDFESEVEVVFDSFEEKPPVTVRFPYLLSAKPRTVFKTVRFNTNASSLVKGVNDTLFTFEKCIERGFVFKDRCIILTEAVPPKKASLVRQLSQFAHLVDVTSQNASRAILSIVESGKPS